MADMKPHDGPGAGSGSGAGALTTPRRDALSHALVVLQFSGLALACYPFAAQSRTAWLALCLAGAALGLITLRYNRPGNFSIYPEPVGRAMLITTGPYRHVRHPMYSALVLMVVGIALYNGHWLNYAGVLGVLVAVGAKARREERYLQRLFADYADYAARTGRFVPQAPRRRPP